MTTPPETRLRRLCLALPDAAERHTFGAPTFRILDKISALYSERNDYPSVWLKTPPGSQAVLVCADPRRFFAPPYLGPKSWIGVRLDLVDGQEPDLAELNALVERSYRLVAPRRLGARLG